MEDDGGTRDKNERVRGWRRAEGEEKRSTHPQKGDAKGRYPVVLPPRRT